MWHIKFIATDKKTAHAALDERVAGRKPSKDDPGVPPQLVPADVVAMLHKAIDAADKPAKGFGLLVECHGHTPDHRAAVDLSMALCVAQSPLPAE